jgi:hypothetical protein
VLGSLAHQQKIARKILKLEQKHLVITVIGTATQRRVMASLAVLVGSESAQQLGWYSLKVADWIGFKRR